MNTRPHNLLCPFRRVPQFVLFAQVFCAAMVAQGSNFPPSHETEANLRWKLDSFRAFSEGSLPDGGVNIYAAADGTVRLINAFDLNGDGLPDILFPSNHGFRQKVDLSIYWNQNPGYSSRHISHLPTEGGKAAAVADLNRDGYQDLIVVNNFDGTTDALNAYVYWGGKDGYAPARRTLLPTQGGEAVTVADLNGDGWPEIIIANSGLDYHEAVDRIRQSYIYWNDHGHFTPKNKTILPSINGRDVVVADLNGDGIPDIVLANAGNTAAEAGARIFWGSRSRAYDQANSTFLPGEDCTAVAVGDLDRDGRSDLVLANGQRLKGREADIYPIVDTVQIDSFVYWNSAEGFSPEHRTSLPTIAAGGAAIADLDGDGWPDVVFANGQGNSSFVYWGSPHGFAPNRRLTLPTHDASAVLAADLNHDGRIDLVFAQSQLKDSYDTDSVIYWGAQGGPAAARCSTLPTSGASAVIAADLNNQGRLDLVFIGQDAGEVATPGSLYLSDRYDPSIFSLARRIKIEGLRGDSYAAADLNLDGKPDLVANGDGVSIFWGSDSGYRRGNATLVTGKYAENVRVADFNRDGYLDLALSEWEPGSTETHIYYGGPGGFSSAARATLPIGGVRALTIADFNKDGWLDIAYPCFEEGRVIIFWGGPGGFDARRRTELPSKSAVSLQAADLNRDGYLDLVVPGLMDLHPPPGNASKAFGGSPQAATYVYWGSAEGFRIDRRTELSVLGAEQVAVADLNRNGRLDLVVSSYHGGTSRSFPSYIFWQGPHGFDSNNVTRLPTNSASGVTIADFNGDGWPDIVFANHIANGDHNNESYLYWGGPKGFSTDRRLGLPAWGPHMLSLVDPGNIYDRRPAYRYVSPAKDFPAAKRIRSINWTADVPPGASVSLQVRSGDSPEELAKAKWEGGEGPGGEFTLPVETIGLVLHGPWIQFQAILSNPGGGLPVLRSVTLDFE